MSDCISLILSILKPPCLVKSTGDTFDSVFHFNLLSFSFPVFLSPSIFLPPNSVSLPFLVCCVLSYILNCFLQFICLFLSSLNSLTIFTSKVLNSPSGILLISVSLDFVIGELWLFGTVLMPCLFMFLVFLCCNLHLCCVGTSPVLFKDISKQSSLESSGASTTQRRENKPLLGGFPLSLLSSHMVPPPFQGITFLLLFHGGF